MFKKINSLILIAVIALIAACGGNGGGGSGGEAIHPAIKAAAERHPANLPITRKEEHKKVTPWGVSVYSEREVSTENLERIDQGIQSAIADGLATWPQPKEAKWQDPKFYRVLIPTTGCHQVGGTYVMALRVRTPVGVPLDQQAYRDGGPWDQYNPEGKGVQDGISVIWAPERLTSYGEDFASSQHDITVAEGMICLEDAAGVANFARYFAEHVIAYWEDRAWETSIRDHGPGEEHPILPRR